MRHFIGEVVRWNPGDHHALVRASHTFSKTGMDLLSPFQAEKEFPPKGTAMWVKPGTAMLNRFVLFEKQPANQFGDGTKTPKFRSEVKQLQVVVPNPWPRTRQPTPTELLHHVAEILSSSDLHLFCQGFRVLIKDEDHQLDYYGPFEMKGGRLIPPVTLSKIKRFRSTKGDLPLIRSGEWDLTFLHPEADLEKVDEISIHVPTVAGALEKLAGLYPQLRALGPYLDQLRELLSEPSGLDPDEAALLGEQLAKTEGVDAQLTAMLPILGEHTLVAGYYDSELKRHKKAIEEEAHSKALEQLLALKQEAMDLHKQAREDMEEMATQQAAIALEHATLQSREQALLERENTAESLGTRLKAQGKEFVDEVAFGLRTGYLLSVGGATPASLKSEHPWTTPEEFLSIARKHPPLARVFTALQARRVPMACGPQSLRLLQTFARMICGGVSRIVPIDPLTVRVRDFIGTFVNGRFQADSSGLAQLLLSSIDLEHPSLVIFEGVNRAALELVLDPVLQAREAGIPLFPMEAFQPDDPWAPLGGLVWPDRLLVSATLSTGVSTQRIAPPMWGRLMLVDEDGWPKTDPEVKTTRLRANQWDGFGNPKPSVSIENACREFIEAVPDAGWAGRGVPTCVARLDDLGVSEALEDAMALVWGPAALSAKAGLETFEDHLQGGSMARLRTLTHYLF